MKIKKYLLVLFIAMNLLASCTADTSVEEGIEAEKQEMLSNGDQDTPLDIDEG